MGDTRTTMSEPGKAVMLSLSALAREFGCARETLRKRLIAANVRPTRGEAPPAQITIDGTDDAPAATGELYALRDAIRAWLAPSESGLDPQQLDPFRRLSHYKAELERLKLEAEMRELIPSADVEQEMARILKIIAQLLDTLPDIIERDCGATADQVKRIERAIDDVRESLFNELANEVQSVDQEGRTHA
jgi:hypothetical protein